MWYKVFFEIGSLHLNLEIADLSGMEVFKLQEYSYLPTTTGVAAISPHKHLGWNSGLHVCTDIALQSETSPQSQGHYHSAFNRSCLLVMGTVVWMLQIERERERVHAGVAPATHSAVVLRPHK